MGLWNIFKQKKDETPSLPEIKKEDFVDESNPSSDGKITISYGTRMPIDLIYNFLKEDYDSKGYGDALNNPDISYRDMNKDIIKSKLEVMFKQVSLKYNDVLRELDFQITTRTQAGLVDLVRQLESKKETYLQHIKELNQMKQDFIDQKPYMTGMLLSYDKGFSKGLAAISLEKMNKIEANFKD